MKRLIILAIALLAVAILVPTGTALAAKGGAATIWVPAEYATIQKAVDNANDGDTIMVSPGSHAGALVDKSVEIKGTGGATIDDGPAHGSGLVQGFRMLTGSDGATISHLRFTVDLVIMNGAAVDYVTVTHNTFVDSVQGVSNWRGTGWNISHNDFVDLRTLNGGGIAILVGDYLGGTVRDNVVSHNKISGTLHVSDGDCGDYNGTGIVLYADFRWGMPGSVAITENRVVKNRISLTSDTPDVVDVVAIELTDTKNTTADTSVVFGNAIGFNDLRGTELQIALTPADLGDVNDISRNLGVNRGHGLHPSVFGPGGN